jgi:hypothetical protein
VGWFLNLNLIRLFDFYLALTFLLSTWMRWHQYEAIIRLVRAVPDRWPRLLKLVRQHHAIFLTWTTALPALLALALSLIHMMVCRLVWPHANLTVHDLFRHLGASCVIVPLGWAMLAFDGYGIFRVGAVDRQLLEKYFDQAEYWLRSWVAPVVHIFTLGYISPRKMVTVEVQKALLEASRLLNSTLWWVSIQAILRIAFGLALWLTWAWTLRA